MISARLPSVLLTSDAHIEPPPLPTMTKSYVSSQLDMLFVHELAQRAMEVRNRGLLQRIGACAPEAARLHSVLDFAHVLEILRQDQAEVFDHVGLPIVLAVIELALERRLGPRCETRQRPDVVDARIRVVPVGARTIRKHAVRPV